MSAPNSQNVRTFLRVFQPPADEPVTGDQPPQISASMTLGEFFEAAFVPLKLGMRSPDTVQLMRDAVNYWARLTENRPLWGIDDFAAADFVSELQSQRGRKSEFLSSQTVRRHCNSIQAILDFAGPNTRSRKRERSNQNLIEDPPYLDKPPADQDPPDGDFTLDELQRMLDAAGGMDRPAVPGVAPAAWWTAFLTVAYFTGLRIGTLMRLNYDDVAADGRIVVRAAIAKKRKGRRQYLTEQARDAIESIRTDRRRIFLVPAKPTKKYPIAPESAWDTNDRWFQTLFKRLLARAGIPKDRQFGFHGLRKLHATVMAAAADDKDGIKNAQLSLGHGKSTTTLKSYVNYTVVERLQAKAIEALPDPRLRRKVDDQKRLFD